ncbi:MAG: DNA-directed RNA polymerase subunit alpha [Candidatus Organicella extenuata]|uniref:DNA-directed RNA polymerase subunit alpha n=1 Tax=Candidatus Organicella extenuata TaxID=2841811 RepID=A0AA51BM28_9BACT|nr:MAG: DNA-directed RNA polymerase subunit alpha [Candidatus Organicella extenuata]
MKNFIRIPRPKVYKKNYISNKTYCKYVIEPLSEGFSQTLGLALRRTLLYNMEGMCVAWIHIKGVKHEFQVIDGVVEDLTNLVLNFKKALVVSKTKKSIIITSKVSNYKGPLFLKDLVVSDEVYLVNPFCKILTLTKKLDFVITLKLQVGQGYIKQNNNTSGEFKIYRDIILIDCLYNPILLVKYKTLPYASSTGGEARLESLILELWTDGRINADKALKNSSELVKWHFNVFNSMSKESLGIQSKKSNLVSEKSTLKKIFNISVNEIELSVRSTNCLNNANITTVGELCSKTEVEMLKYKNFGKKSLSEIRDRLKQFNLHLGINLNKKL